MFQYGLAEFVVHTPPIVFSHHESLAILNALNQNTALSPLYNYSATSNNVIIIGPISIIGFDRFQ